MAADRGRLHGSDDAPDRAVPRDAGLVVARLALLRPLAAGISATCSHGTDMTPRPAHLSTEASWTNIVRIAWSVAVFLFLPRAIRVVGPTAGGPRRRSRRPTTFTLPPVPLTPPPQARRAFLWSK